MNIYTLPDKKIKCITLDAGYDHHKKVAEEYLKVGEEYTVVRTYVDSFHTDVLIKEVPDIKFNSVFFENVDHQSKEENQNHPDYWYFN